MNDHCSGLFLSLIARHQQAYEAADAALRDDTVPFEVQKQWVREFLEAGDDLLRFTLGAEIL